MMRRAVMVVLIALPGFGQEVYDVLLKGGHVIDPKNKRNERLDIAILKDRIVKIAPSLAASQARRVIDVSAYYVTPGLIDIHARFDADHNFLRFGVTTAVDSGSSGAKDFEQFRKSTIARSKTRVLAFLRDDGDAEAAAHVAMQHPQAIVGFTAGADVKQAVKAAELSKTIVMAESPNLRPGDIQTRMYALPGGDARKNGVLLDVGHGSSGFLFRIAGPALKQGHLPDTISTGLDKDSLLLPRATMTNVMSKFLALGLTAEQVIERTTLRPARAIRRADLGSLEVGGVADIAVFEIRKGRFALLDSGHSKLTADREVRCVLTVRDGDVVWDSEGLSLTDWQDAGPYSNFK